MADMIPITIVDAFTSEAFSGNPAGVCLLSQKLDEAVMQHIAMEMNLSETAFAERLGDGHYHLRWFTPQCEVDLCGHATLATIHALREAGLITPGAQVLFETLSGELRAWVNADESITLDFPAQAGQETDITPALQACLGVPIRAAVRNEANILAEVDDMGALDSCAPDFSVIAKLPAQGLIVTAAAGCVQYDFASRYFAPQVGIPEDPVCGSAHCLLAPYWAEKLGKSEFHAYQASRRTGELQLTLTENGRLHITGCAVTTMNGQMTLPVPQRGNAPIMPTVCAA